MASKMGLLYLAALLLLMCPVKGQFNPVKGFTPIRPRNGTSPPAAVPIMYQGGPVMVNTITVYPIWYGKTGFTDTQRNILRNLIQSYSDNGDTCAKCNQDPDVGGCKCDNNCDCTDKCAKCNMPAPWGGCKCNNLNDCDCVNGFHNPSFKPNGAPTVQNWWGVELEYYQTDGKHVSPIVVLGGEYSDTSASQGTQNPSIYNIVANAIAQGLNTDADGVYAVFTDADVTVDGFCTQFCGYHTWGTFNQQTLKYMVVGNSGKQCPSSCTAQPSASPNGDVGIDGMASVFSHELAETASDPFIDAWIDSDGNENADKCSWGHLGTTFDAGSGGKYNVVGNGGVRYLIQSNWDLATNACQLTAGGRSTVVS